MRKRDGDGGVVGVGSWVEMWVGTKIAVPLVSIQRSTMVHSYVVWMWGSVVLQVIWVVGF